MISTSSSFWQPPACTYTFGMCSDPIVELVVADGGLTERTPTLPASVTNVAVVGDLAREPKATASCRRKHQAGLGHKDLSAPLGVLKFKAPSPEAIDRQVFASYPLPTPRARGALIFHVNNQPDR
jgi:hypothetical protein